MQGTGRVWIALLALLAGACSEGSNDGSASGNTGGVGSAAGGPGAAGVSGNLGGGGGAGQAGTPGLVSDELCGVRPGGSLGERHVLRFENLEPTDEHVVVQLERTNMGVGVGESWLFELNAFHVLRAGESECVTQPSSLEYQNSHHNWFDIARGTAGGVTYELQMNFDGLFEPEPDQLSATNADGSYLFGPVAMLSTGSPPFCSNCLDPVAVGISEVMLENVDAYADEAGEYEPWIELYNVSADDVDLSGWHLSDDFADRKRWPLPAVTIPRSTRMLVIVADGQLDQGQLHTSFELGPSGGQLILTDPQGRTEGGLLLAPQGPGKSVAFSWTSGSYELGTPTPGVSPPEP